MHVSRIVLALLHRAGIEECTCLATILIDGQARICNTLAKCDRLWIKYIRSTSMTSCTFVSLSALCRRSPRRHMHMDTLIVLDKAIYGTYIHVHGEYRI